MTWTEFLNQQPTLWKARDLLDDEAFLTFLQQIFRETNPKRGHKNSLAWHAFEECGWPEGRRYCQTGSPEYSLYMFSPKNHKDKIHDRLALRQHAWKSNRSEHTEAHMLLNTLLQNFLEKTQGFQLQAA